MKIGAFLTGVKNFVTDHPMISAATAVSMFGFTTHCISSIHQTNAYKNMPPEYWEAEKARYESQKCNVRIE